MNVWLLVICWNFDETRSIHHTLDGAENELLRVVKEHYGDDYKANLDDVIYSIEEYVVQ